MQYLLLLVFILPCFGLSAQVHDPVALGILDKVSLKYKSYKSYKVNYEVASESPAGKTMDSRKGEILVSGQKFVLSLPDQDVFCNGATLWTYLKEAREVNISDYEPGSDEITPQSIFTLYQRGYKYVYWGEQKDHKTTLQIVDLEPEDRKNEVLKVRLFVNKADKSVKRWIVFERGSGNRQVFTLSKVTPNIPVTDATFAFSKTKHPGVKEIDLR